MTFTRARQLPHRTHDSPPLFSGSQVKHRWMVSVYAVIVSRPTVALRHHGLHHPASSLVLSRITPHPICSHYHGRYKSGFAAQPSPYSLHPNAAAQPTAGEKDAGGTSATDFLDYQRSLFPTEFSEWIKQDVSSHSRDEISEDEREAYAAARPETQRGFVADELECDRESRPSLRARLDQLFSIFLPSHVRRNKVDLSYANSLEWEANPRKLEQPATLSFRSSSCLRKLTLDYLSNIEPLFHGQLGSRSVFAAEDNLSAALRSTFPQESLAELGNLGYDVSDVASWAWIFSSQTADRAVARYIALAEDLRQSAHGKIPRFVPLQLLRAESLSAFALRGLIRCVLTDLQICLETKDFSEWGWRTRVCLIVRLLRHTRRVAPDCLDDVSLVVKRLFSDFYTVHPENLDSPELQRLAHIYNRFLSLIALTTLKIPYNAYLLQQNAQLALVRLMVAFKPQLPLNREGYRALIAVQLLHRKTAAERTWAEAKSPSWPPWRQVKSGIEQDLEYSGKESRVTRLLRRMHEAGYTHGVWEKTAAVLGGWDTDNSPTIQTRAILKKQRRPWLLSDSSADPTDGRNNNQPELWAARIRATRSKREAWASFCAFEKSRGSSKAHYHPYFAMLEKLLSKTVPSNSMQGSKHVAGDVKETFEDPTNPREVIYIEQDVPSPSELYEHMLRQGIKPAGGLLSTLLDHAPDAVVGFSYIQDSRWDEVTKDVLRYAGKYPQAIIRDTLNKIPAHSLAAFISLLCRSGYDDQPTFSDIGYFDAGAGQHTKKNHDVPPLTYAWQLLLAANVTDIEIWNAFLKGALSGIVKQSLTLKDEKPSYNKNLAFKITIWPFLYRLLSSERTYVDIHPDLDTFRHSAAILSLMTRDPQLHVSTKFFGALAKSTFVRAAYVRHMGKRFLPSAATTPLMATPEPKDLQLLVRILVSLHDIEGLLALVTWLNGHAETFEPLNRYQAQRPGVEDRSLRPGGEAEQEDEDDARAASSLPPLRHVLCAVRLFLEPPRSSSSSSLSASEEAQAEAEPAEQEENPFYFHTPLATDQDLLHEAQRRCEALGWPTDDEVRRFLAHDANVKWVERVTRAAEVVALKEARRRRG